MSSATSTDSQPLTSNQAGQTRDDTSLAPWQFFTLAGLIGATIVVFLSEGQSPAAIILLSCVIFGAAAIGATAWRMFAPLAGEDGPAGPQILGGRTRAALEREKTLVLRSIKDLEFDHAMGKVSDNDFAEMGARLRGRAAGLLRQLDAGSGYRDAIQLELDKRLGPRKGSAPKPAAPAPSVIVAPASAASAAPASASTKRCPSCGTANDPDARFCKGCGHQMGNS